MSMRRFSLIVFLAGFAVRLGLVLASGQYRDLSRYELEQVALSFARTGELANPYLVPTGPTAHVMPGYAILLGTIFRLFGEGLGGELVKQGLSCLIAALRNALLAGVAMRLGFGRAVAILVGLLSIVYIPALETETAGDWESPLFSLLLLVACMRMLAPKSNQTGWWSALVLGALWGAAYLVNATALPVAAALLALGIYRSGRRGFWTAAQRAAVVAAMVIALVAPWAIRNYLRLGALICSRSNFGLELQLSYHQGADWRMLANVKALHPAHNRDEAILVRQLGEVEYNRRKLHEAWTWMRANPLDAASLTAQHVFHFWFPPGRNLYHTLLLAAFTLLGGVGILMVVRSNHGLAASLGVILLSYSLVFYLVQWSSRYRYPVEWLLLLLVSVGIVDLAKRLPVVQRTFLA
jgi:hypothetical protein